MKKGIRSRNFPNNFTMDMILRVSKEIGYDGVELVSNEHLLRASRSELKTLASEANSLGLVLPSLCAGWIGWRYNLANPDKTMRERGVEFLKDACKTASILESKHVLVVPALAVPEISYQETWELSKISISEVAPIAAEYDVLLGIENVWNRFLYSPLEFRSFIEEIDHPNVKAYFDVGNIYCFGFPQQWIRHLSDLIACVHVKDFTRSTFEFKPLLEGDVPWPEVMKALREIGYDDFITVELSPYPSHPTKSAIDAKTALDLIFKM